MSEMKCDVCQFIHGDYEYIEFSSEKNCDVYKCAKCNGYSYRPGKKVEYNKRKKK